MKALIALLAITAACFAQNIPTGRTSLSVDVRGVASRGVTRDEFKTDYGSFDKHAERERVIEAAFSNLGKDIAAGLVKVTWTGTTTGKKQRVILKQTILPLVMSPGGTVKVEFASGAHGSRDMRLKLIGERVTGGAKIEGWIVSVRDMDDNLVILKTSSPALADAVRVGERWDFFSESAKPTKGARISDAKAAAEITKQSGL